MSTLVYTVTTGSDPVVLDPAFADADPAREEQWFCPGSNGEISSGMCRRVYGDRCFCW